MGSLDLLMHLLGFAAPAAAVALGVAAGARLFGRARPGRWWMAALLNFVAGVAVLAAGLWYSGRDGRMATYALLVLAVATTQWLAGRSWKA